MHLCVSLTLKVQMRYWWVNQKQAYRREIKGGYFWSPIRNKNQARDQFYETMGEVAPGDLICSYRDRHIPAIGIADSCCYERPKLGFNGNGQLIISPSAHRPCLKRMGPETESTVNVGTCSQIQKAFLAFHRESVLPPSHQ